jgi:putative membrane protein
VPKQKKREIYVTKRTFPRAIASGSFAGIASGFLPGVGSSELSAFASVDKNEKSFLVTFGAITISNVLLSLLSLWLIGRARSGIAVVIEQIIEIGFSEALLIVAVALIAVSLSAIITLYLSKKFIAFIEKINYSLVSMVVLFLIIIMTAIFTGIYGLVILATCTALGIIVNKLNIKRGLLMAVLIVPTIAFYMPL